MSQIIKNGSGGGGGSGIIQTIAGDTGTPITGAAVTIFANQATFNSGSTVGFNNGGTVSTLNVTDAALNTIIGQGSGSTLVSTIGTENTVLGALSLANATGNHAGNVAIGVGVLNVAASAQTNVGIGQGALENGTNLTDNIAIGFSALNLLQTGQNNISIGSQSGLAYVGSESNNVLLYGPGVAGDNNVIRIGLSSAQFSAFMAGIEGVTVAASSPVGIDSAGQLSDLGFGTATNVLTSNGPGVSPTWQAAGGGGASTSLSVVMTTPETLTQNTLSQITYDTVLVDTAGGYSTGFYTIPLGGTGNWYISVVANFTTAVSFINGDVFINKNSGTLLAHLFPAVSADGVTIINVSGSGIFPLVAGDIIQIDVFSQTTGAVPLVASGLANGFQNIFSMYKLP